MKNLYVKYISIILLTLLCNGLYAQTYITWNPINGGAGITGTAGTVNVFSTLTPGTTPFSFTSPAMVQANLIVNGARTFSTFGSTNQGVSRDMTINFSQPVIVTRYNMVDIDLGFSWNDTFNFLGINFSNNPNPIAVNCTANLNGAIATTDVGGNAENASWFCSNPVTSFTVDYQTTGVLTHAYLGYSIEVLIPPSINNNNNTLCLNDTQPPFPIVGNNIVGTWNPNTISTSSVGSTVYTFTPAAGQPIQCPITMTVNVNDCCIPTSTSNTLINTMVQEERGDWISSSDLVTFSSSTLGDGVVYHALNYVDLIPGFDAINGSNFAAYPEGCSGSYVYRNLKSNENFKDVIKENTTIFDVNNTSHFSVAFEQNENRLNIKMVNLFSEELKIYSLDGKMIYQDFSKEKDGYQLDTSAFSPGVYLITIVLGDGSLSTEKFIKN